MKPDKKKRLRILFIAETVALAHLTRPLLLARSLDPDRYEIHFACAQGHEQFFEGAGFAVTSIRTVPSRQFLIALAKGLHTYSRQTLLDYVEDDLRILDQIQPDVVVGDLRHTLTVSAKLRKIPHVAIANFHWSPYASIKRFPVPENPLVKAIGVRGMGIFLRLFQPMLLAIYARPLNQVRRKYGLSPLGDMRHVMTHGDYTLYADIPSLFPANGLPPNHRFLGPVLWSPNVAYPSWWNTTPTDRPCIYVTLGSSGQVKYLPLLVEALAELPVTLLVATAGRITLSNPPGNVLTADFLPGTEAARRSSLVVCNGGSATAYQALDAGVPVLGIAYNIDQYLTMSAVVRKGAGILLRSGRLSTTSVRDAAQRILTNPEYRNAAGKIAQECAQYDAPAVFHDFLQATF
jgi:UDP:flavonoid glycosyltransferase YjiC (YdhE family)